MSDQTDFSTLPSPLQRMNNLLRLRNRGDEFITYLAHVELCARCFITHDLMEYGLKNIHGMFRRDRDLHQIHKDLLDGPNCFTEPLSSMEDYKRIRDFIDRVHWRSEPVDEATHKEVFDSLLNMHKLLIDLMLNERQRQMQMQRQTQQ